MRPAREQCEDDAPQRAPQGTSFSAMPSSTPNSSVGHTQGWQGAAHWGHPGSLAGWEMANAWEAATRSSYSMPYGLPHQQQMLTPQLHQQPQITDGLIFLCDPQTEEECLQRGLFGTPASQAPLVRQVAPEATLLFLFNVRTRVMSGIFRATSWPQLNLEPSAWGENPSGGSRYPLQVRVRLETDVVLQVGEDRIRNLLEYRGSHNRFDMQLSKERAEAISLIFSQYGQQRLAIPSIGTSGALHHRLSGNVHRPPVHPLVDASRAGGSRERQWRNGVIFICDSSTEHECLSRRLLGLPKSQASLISKMGDSSFLFLFNVRTRQLIGVLQPDGPAGMDLEPSAWGGGRFPVQVRFRPASPSGQIFSLPEAALGDVLRYRNATARFDLLLRAKSLDKLIDLFAQYGIPINQSGTGVMFSVPQPMHEVLPYGVSAMAAAQPHHLPPMPMLAPMQTLQQSLPPLNLEQQGRAAKDPRASDVDGERGSRSSGGGFSEPSADAAQQLPSMLGSLTIDQHTG